MHKKTLLTIFALLLLSTSIASVSAPLPPQARPGEIAVGTIGEPETVDPQWLYDTASAEIVSNVYDPLISFKVDRTTSPLDVKTWGKTDEFVPNLATEWYLDETTDPDHPVYYFKIDTTVKFQNDHVLTTEDVEYTFERWFVLDHGGGPQWMIYEPLTYPDYEWPDANEDGIPDPEFAPIVDAAIESNSTHVWFTFAGPYPTMIFLQVIAQSWACILSKDWAIAQGCWDGNWATVPDYHDPLVSPLMDPQPVMMGTGPYYFVEWTTAKHWVIERYVGYHEGWPIPGCDGFVDRVRVEFISEWPTRKLMFLAGDLDFCYVPRMFMGDVDGKPGIRCIHPLETLACDGNFFNFDIQTTSRYLKPPFTETLAVDEIKGTGIPPNFFTDVNLRRAFLYSVNYTEFIEIAFLGEAVYPATPAIFNLPYRLSQAWYAEHQYYLNLTEAEYYFKLAWGGTGENPGHDPSMVTPGQVWTNGFTLPLCYNVGNLPRKTMAEIIETNAESLNTQFTIDVYEVEWGTVYIPELFHGELTMFIIGWLADYPDPHNFFFPFMHTYGAFSGWQYYSNPAADVLIEEGGTCANETRREEIYAELQEMYIDDAPSVCTDQATGRHWERTWIHGWYYNPIYPGGWFKHYWKDVPPEVSAMEPVDVTAQAGSITPSVDGCCILPSFNCSEDHEYLGMDWRCGEVSVWYEPGETWTTFTVSIHRDDTNTGVVGFFIVIGLARVDKETGYITVIGDLDYLYMGTPGTEVTADFEWNEEWLSRDDLLKKYVVQGLTGVASGYCYDMDPANNTISAGNVNVIYWGNMDGDCDIDYDDIVYFADGYILYWTPPGETDPLCDFDCDDDVDYDDIVNFADSYILYWTP